MTEQQNIPKHWEIKKLGEVCEKITKGGTPTTYGFSFVNEGINFIKVENVENGKVKLDSIRNFISQEAHDFQKKSKLQENDLLFSIAGTIGETCLIKNEYLPANTNQALAILRGYMRYITPNYLTYQLNSSIVQYIKSKARGGAMNNISLEDLKNIDVVLPPLAEQEAIVAKIEELLSDLENGKQQLLKAQQQLKVYRQSLLKWAFEGKLTNKNVKEGELPENWKWTTFGNVCSKIGDIDHKMPKQISVGYPYVSTKDFTDDLKISFENAKYISEEDYLNLSRKIKPEKGDIIFPRYGTIGKNILIDFDKDFLVSYSCAILKPVKSLINSKFAYLYSLSPKIQEEIRKYIVETTQANIGIASIKSFVFPLPPLSEQQQIVEILESKLTVCDKLEETISRSLAQSETLRQSILKRAFEGRLV